MPGVCEKVAQKKKPQYIRETRNHGVFVSVNGSDPNSDASKKVISVMQNTNRTYFKLNLSGYREWVEIMECK